jgi:hypothetical protein
MGSEPRSRLARTSRGGPGGPLGSGG